MNKLTKVALPALAFCGVFLGASANVSATSSVDDTTLELLPSPLSISLKESAYVTNLESSTVDNAVKAAVTAALEDENVDLTGFNVYASCGYDDNYAFDIYSCHITLDDAVNTSTSYQSAENTYTRTISIEYANTPSSKSTAVQTKLDAALIKATDGDSYFPVTYNLYPIGTEESDIYGDDIEDTTETQAKAKVVALLSDSSYSVYSVTSALGADGNGLLLALSDILVFKDDVLYGHTTSFTGYGYGYLLNETTPVVMYELDEEGEVYIEMKAKMATLGYSDIFAAYELNLAVSYSGNIPVTFDLGNDYDGKTALILHKKSDGTYEQFEETVANGQVSITVSSLSPFMIAVKDSNSSSVLSPDTGAASKGDHSGVTASVLATLIAAGLSLGAFAGFKKLAKKEA